MPVTPAKWQCEWRTSDADAEPARHGMKRQARSYCSTALYSTKRWMRLLKSPYEPGCLVWQASSMRLGTLYA